jgi:hypothetical protein
MRNDEHSHEFSLPANPCTVLPTSELTSLNYCTSAQGVFNDGASAQRMHEGMSKYAPLCASKTLALFFHGGLVDKPGAINTAQQLIGPYQAQDGGNAFPYFFVWESGIWEILQQRLPQILKDAAFQWLIGLIFGKVTSVRARPVDNTALSEAELQEVQRQIESGPSSAVVDLTKRALILGGIGNVFANIFRRESSGHSHGLLNTAMEETLRAFFLGELGASIWSAMKTSTARAFEDDADRYVGSAMIKELISLYESGPDGEKARITLIGHSAGSVYVVEFLRAMTKALEHKAYAKRIRFDIIFMAPAARVDIFAETLEKYGEHIRNFRCFEMSDPLESSEILVDFPGIRSLYTSSLLYFISGVLEESDGDTPLVGMQRFFSGKGPFAPGKVGSIDAVLRFYASHHYGVVCSDTNAVIPPPPLGQQCTSHHHGCFTTDFGTLRSVSYLLSTGNY